MRPYRPTSAMNEEQQSKNNKNQLSLITAIQNSLKQSMKSQIITCKLFGCIDSNKSSHTSTNNTHNKHTKPEYINQ